MSCLTHAFYVAWHLDDSTAVRDVTVVLENGAVAEVRQGRLPGATDLGPVAWIPGLVNAHTHLEFSALTTPFPTSGRFTDWIRQVIGYRMANPDVTPHAVRTGLAESLSSGTTLIGDIATQGWTVDNYHVPGAAGIVFQELLGLGPARVQAQAELGLTVLQTPSADAVTFGLSPHAPYSVHPDLLESAISTSQQTGAPVAMHLAETRAELELLAHDRGEFREFLESLGLWQPGLFGGLRPLDYLRRLSACPRVLIIHGNYLDDEELDYLASQPHMTLVYCPRTHAAFGHSDHPWQPLIARGGSVAIGTDSRASNPDLSVFAELQALARRHPGISHLELLRFGSVNGRQALSGNAESRTPLKGNATVVTLTEPGHPEQTLFAAGNRIAGALVNGVWFPVGIAGEPPR